MPTEGESGSLRRLLGMPEDEPIAPERLESLAWVLCAAMSNLDQVAWSTWEQVAPKSDLRRRAPLKEAVRAYLAGDRESAKIQEDAESTRLLCACLISALSQAGHLAHRRMADLAPEEIESFARLERKWHEGLESACWRKYRELAGTLDESSVESEMLRRLGEYVESLVEGSARVKRTGSA